MTLTNWITILSVLIPSLVALVVWLVRLEGRISTSSLRIQTLEDQAKLHTETKEAVIRLQEKVDQLRELVQQFVLKTDGR